MKRFTFTLFIGGLLALPAAAETTNDLPVLTLESAQQVALKNHPQIMAANYLALAAKESVKEARAGFFPNVNAYADAVAADDQGTRILAGGLNNPSVYDRGAGGVQASQLITDFGKTANLTASSKFQAQAADQSANTTREQVLLQVQAGYFSALEAQAVLRVAQQTVDTRKLLLDQVSVLATNKLKSELDVSFARVQLGQGQLLLQTAQNNADDQMTSLSTALGYREPHQFQLVEPTETNSSGTNDVSDLVQLALAQRPELLRLRDEQQAADRLARSQRDSRLPTISAIGVAGGSPDHNSHLDDQYAAGGVQLSLPLFAGGYYSARQHEAELKAESDSELLRSLEDNVVRDVHLAWLDVNKAQAKLQTADELARNAQESYDLAQARYQAGSSSIVELSQAQLALTQAQIDDTSARYNVLIQQANLDYQTGTLR